MTFEFRPLQDADDGRERHGYFINSTGKCPWPNCERPPLLGEDGHLRAREKNAWLLHILACLHSISRKSYDSSAKLNVERKVEVEIGLDMS